MQWSIHLNVRGLRTIFFNILYAVQSRLVELSLGVGEGSVRIGFIAVAFYTRFTCVAIGSIFCY
jgi:hypothetical protein